METLWTSFLIRRKSTDSAILIGPGPHATISLSPFLKRRADTVPTLGRWHLLVPLASVLLSACALPTAPPEEPPVAAESSDPPRPEEPLDPEFIYDYLLADIAVRRGDTAAALDAQLRLAARSDIAVVVRAFRTAVEAGDSEAALRLTDRLAEVGADPMQVSFARIQVLVKSGRVEEAVDGLRALLAESEEQRERVFNNAGELFSRQPHPRSYVGTMMELAEEYPDDRNGHFAAAYVANRAGDVDALERAISKALALSPGWEKAASVKLAYLVRGGDRQVVDDFALAFLDINPQAVDFRERYARYLAGSGDTASAAVQLDRVLQDRPDNPDVLMAAALVYMDLEKWAGSRRYLLRYLAVRPDDDQARMYLGLVAASRDRHDEAIEWYREVRDETLLFDAQMRIAGAIEERGDGEAALEHLARVVPLSSDEEIRVYLSRERVLRGLDRLAEAHRMIDGALQEFPDHPDLLYSRGLLAAELELLEQHEQDIRRVIELDPDNAHAYNALGYTLADRTDRYKEALDLITTALELAPDDPFILDSMGWVQFRLGRAEVAAGYLRRALAIREDAEIAAHLGEVLWSSGERAEAERLWADALKRDPENPVLLETLRRFKGQ